MRYTGSIGFVDLNWDSWYPVLPLAPCQTQSEQDFMSESHLSDTSIAAGIVGTSQSALARAMFIRAAIVRDLV